jgi:chromosome segregation ATPase
MPDSAPNTTPSSPPNVASVFASLSEISAVNSELGDFFGGILDELELLLGDLLRQQKDLQLDRQRMEQELEWRRSEMDRQKADMEALKQGILEAVRTEIARAGAGSESIEGHLGELLSSTGEDRQAFRSALDQFQGEMAQLAQAKAELAELGRELKQGFEQLAGAQASAGQSQAWPVMEEQLHRVEKEREELARERAVLETELEALRGRTVEMARTLDQQKHQVVQERSQWGDEIRQLRELVECLSTGRAALRGSVGAVAETAAEGHSGSSAPASAQGRDTVLDSVIAQFELLQKGAARRRKKEVPVGQEQGAGATP